jgi:hypothetical protein
MENTDAASPTRNDEWAKFFRMYHVEVGEYVPEFVEEYDADHRVVFLTRRCAYYLVYMLVCTCFPRWLQ